jgi:cytochrome c
MQERPEDYAKYWVEQAISFYKAVGKDVALAEFSNPNGMFVQGEMYIFVLSTSGKMLAHGVNERFAGIDFIDVKDSDGKPFNREIVDTAIAKGSGWVEYKWYHPRRNRVLPKKAFFQKADDLIVCSAIYIDED